MKEQIGLVIWGCKGGYRATPSNGGPFCSNNVVNTGDEVIAQTVKDIRYFIRLHRTGHDFYAIEFTSKYKVFTNYRSSNDSGTGAFIAFTLYVPHNLKVENMRAMFKEMMDGYFREYMNPLSNTPLTGKYDDINKFSPILGRYEVKADRPYYRQSSLQDDTPKLVIYDDASVVDKYFDSPYRPEFFQCQEVIFLSKEIYDNASAYELDLQKEHEIIKNISEPEAESKLVNNLVGLRLSNLTINGEDMLHTNGNCPLTDSDTISFSIEKNEFCEKFVAQSLVPGKALTVKEAVDNGWLKRRNRRDFEFVQPTRWVPKRYYLPLINTGVETDRLCGRIILFDNYRRIELKKQERGCFFELSGEEVNSVFSLCLIPVNTSSDRPYFMVIQQNVSPKEVFQKGIYTNIIEKVVNKTSKNPDRYHVSINIDDFNLKLATSSNKLSLFLPAAKQSLLKLDFSAEDCKANFDGENVSFVPAFIYVSINKDIIEDRIYNNLKLQFEISGAPYDSMIVRSRGVCFKLLYDHWLTMKNGVDKGHLYYGDEELEYSLNKDFDNISMRAVIVTCSSNTPVHVTINKDGISNTLQMGSNNFLLCPRNRQISVYENVARILDVNSSDNIDVKKVVPIEIAHISDVEEKSGDVKGSLNPDNTNRIERVIVYINCQGFCIRTNKKEYVIRKQIEQQTTKADYVILYKGDRVACLIKPGVNENCSQGKGKNNFTVNWRNDYSCDVEYHKESFIDKITKYKKWLFGLGAFVILFGIAYVAYPMVTKLFSRDYEYTIVVKAEGVIDTIKCNNDFVTSKSVDNNKNKWDVCFNVPSDKIEKVKRQLLQDPQLSLDSKSDGNTTISLRNAMGEGKYKAFKEFFDSENDKRKGEAEIMVELPSQVLYEKLKDDTSEIDIDKCAEAAITYPGKSKDFSELAYQSILHDIEEGKSDSQKAKLEKYKQLSESIPDFKNQSYYDDVNSKLSELDAREKEETAKKEKERERNTQIQIQLNILSNINVTKNQAEVALRQAGILDSKNLKDRANAYIRFFNAKSIDDVKKSMWAFSSEQKNICGQSYAKDSKSFEGFKKRYGMNFSKAKELLKK